MSLAVASATPQTWSPAPPKSARFDEQCQSAIDAIAAVMRTVSVTTLSVSYGKDSSVVLALALEAARQLKANGHNPVVRIITSDTQVENPSQTKLNAVMATRALKWANVQGLDFEQIWVTPDPLNHYLVSMLGGRGVASVAGSDATCSMDLKVRPMEKVRRMLAKTYGAENIVTLIGTRFDESTARGANMRKRGESATKPVRKDTGSLSLSPIAEWSEADVWRLLNGSDKALGFNTLDFAPVLAHYEAMGDATCQTLSIAESTKKAKSPCSGGRGGCFLCQKVSADHSLENMLDKFPHYAPLVRLSKAIRAGHMVPANRSFVSKALDSQNRIRVFSNAYSPSWTSQLLKWVMSIDADEDLRSAARSQKLGRPVPRRFPRLLEPEHELLIAFQWARYGVQKPGEFIRIREAIAQGRRWNLPSDEDLKALEAKADKKLMGKTIGYLKSDLVLEEKSTYRDHWRDLIGTETPCAPSVMKSENGERAWYRNSKGLVHDTIEISDIIECNLADLREADGSLGITYDDFMFWYALDFSGQNKNHNEELNFLVREGIIRARPGYQSTLAEYQRQNQVLDNLRAHGPIDTLEAIKAHPCFIEVDEASPRIIATDAGGIKTHPARESFQADGNNHTEQLDLFAA